MQILAQFFAYFLFKWEKKENLQILKYLAQLFCLFRFSNIKEVYLKILECLPQFFCFLGFWIIKKTILKNPSTIFFLLPLQMGKKRILTNLKIPDTFFFCLFPFWYIKKVYIQILKYLAQFVCWFPLSNI